MPHYPYIIIGGGMAGASAIKGIRSQDSEGTIAVFSMETNPPYARPPLTKGLWKDKSEEDIWYDMEDPHLELHTGHTIKRFQQDNQIAIDAEGETFSYDRLLLATGGTPIRLPFGGEDIIYYRTFKDYQRLRGALKDRTRVAVIGAGFIGQEISASLNMNGHDVTLIFPEDGIGARLYPPDLSAYLNDYYTNKGVHVLHGESVSGIDVRSGEKAVLTESGQEVIVDLVVAAIGIRPNLELAQDAGLQVEDGGIVVNQYLQTSQPDVYSAGDTTAFYSPLLGRRLRMEHENAATSMGETAGKNMAGASEPYHYLPYFYSDLFDLGYEAVGRVNSQLESFADWQEPHQKGVVYYLDEGRVRGVLLWNVWDKVEQARQLMAKEGPFSPDNLKGRL
jgi:3-phenylpropionate/trans-cinnamate dioxygenase ferredoxin reductase component